MHGLHRIDFLGYHYTEIKKIHMHAGIKLKIYLVVENLEIHVSNCLNTSLCQSSRTEEDSTKCFSNRLMSGVGNFS